MEPIKISKNISWESFEKQIGEILKAGQNKSIEIQLDNIESFDPSFGALSEKTYLRVNK